MQDVTTQPFMALVSRYGAPDFFVTEYFRVYAHARPEPHILESITENQTGRPVFAQIIGSDLEAIERMTTELLRYPWAGIDLNLGCPVPKIYRKNVGGGLLRDLDTVARILELLRRVVPGLLTVKTRIGFDDNKPLSRINQLVNDHGVDMLTVHGRTVSMLYRGSTDYDSIARAVAQANVPVIANGDITSASKAAAVLCETGAAGIMVGRHAVRNPWIFRQINETLEGRPVFEPLLGHVREYIDDLFSIMEPSVGEIKDRRNVNLHVSRMKKYMNFIGQGVDAGGQFLYQIRRARTQSEFFRICDAFLVDNGQAELPYAREPYTGLVARPNHEGCQKGQSSPSTDRVTASS